MKGIAIADRLKSMESISTETEPVLSWFGQWRDKPDARLPARVERALLDLRQRSEILIGWVQGTLAVVFGLLYFVAPSTSPIDAIFRPVPWALGLYGGFTLLRLIQAYRNRLSFTFKIASVLVDVTMLMVTIWSFHIEYGQPATFYLKAPTLLYLFIFIVLRGFTGLAAKMPPTDLINMRHAAACSRRPRRGWRHRVGQPGCTGRIDPTWSRPSHPPEIAEQ